MGLKTPKSKTKVMVFGTFDLIHKGHLHFFDAARKLAENPFLIVSIARDRNVKKIKGQKPLHSETVRLNKIAKLPIVDKAVLSGLGDHIPHILNQRPDVLALGYDQRAYVKNLKELLEKKGLSVKIYRLKPYKKSVYSSSKLKKKL